MSAMTKATDVVKNYFDNAAVIDDQLYLINLELPVYSDSDLRALPDNAELNLGTGESAATVEAEAIVNQSSFLFDELSKEGIVVFPYRYRNTSDAEQLSYLTPILKNVKMLFLDWNLEEAGSESVSKPGTAALSILNRYVENASGLRCAVIYTQADNDEVLKKISDLYHILDEDNYFFQEKTLSEIEGNSLFGFIVNKSITPSVIIQKISSILLKDKCIPLHVMDSVYRLETNVANVMNKLNAPFEQVLFTQILSSGIEHDNVPKFLDNTLLSNVLSEQSKSVPVNLLFGAKREKIKKALTDKMVSSSEIAEFGEIIKLKGQTNLGNLFDSVVVRDALMRILGIQSISSIEEFREELLKIPAVISSNVINELLLFLFLLPDYRLDPDKFKEQFQTQIYYLTKLLKYAESSGKKVLTGSIWKRRNSNRFLLCITPFCDTNRPLKVESIYKFLSGQNLGALSNEDLEKHLKNNEENFACLSVPNDSTKKVDLIKLQYFNVISIVEAELRRDYEYVSVLKKEYTQNVINRYIAYQSRAGVDEMFYKETYRTNFLKFFG